MSFFRAALDAVDEFPVPFVLFGLAVGGLAIVVAFAAA